MYRYAAPDDLTDLVRRFWLPVWSVPPGEVAVQRVLQYPVALAVVTPAYGRFTGVARGISSTELVGDGWAVGVMFQPAAGSLLTGGPMDEWTDRADDLRAAVGPVGDEVVAAVRAAMADDPHDEAAHRVAADLLAGLGPSGRPRRRRGAVGQPGGRPGRGPTRPSSTWRPCASRPTCRSGPSSASPVDGSGSRLAG